MKSSVPTMASLVLDDGFLLEEREEEFDLSYWEFINNSDADYSDDSLSVDSLSDGIASSLSSIRQDETQITHDEDIDDPRSCHGDDDLNDGYRPYDEGRRCLVGYQYSRRDYAGNRYGEEEDDEDEDENEEFDGYDLDDELVPRSLSGKLGRQRMRKLGKRAFSKMNTSKRSPYLYVKPGCVHGKHGLGMKHSY